MIKYPKNIKVSIEHFRSINLKNVVKSSKHKDYYGFHTAFSKAAKKAYEKNELKKCKIFWLFADACSMILNPSSRNEPFKPGTILYNRRSAIPEDFGKEDIELFADMIKEINNLFLKARLADLVWLLKHPRNPKYALIAIDAYRKIRINEHRWRRKGRECLERAICLSLMLGEAAHDRLKKIDNKLISAFKKTTYKNGFLPLELSELILKYNFTRKNRSYIAQKLENIADHFNSKGNYRNCRDYYDAASEWYKVIGDNEKFVEMNISVAESWVKEADVRLSSKQPSNMVANRYLENAIQRYRSIPRVDRKGRDIDKRISELHTKLRETGEKSISEMNRISTPRVNITEMVESAREIVRGKKLIDALFQLSNIHKGARINQDRQFAEKTLSQNPIQAFISSTHMSRDGRVVAKRPGAKIKSNNSIDNDNLVWAEIVKNYQIGIDIAVQGLILPALDVVTMEHRIKETVFINIAKQSPIVPKDRCELMGKGLFAGYDKDFVSAIHILTPQIEHIVRWRLKFFNVKTTMLDSNGIENEIGLSKLMDKPKVREVFGEDIEFEIKALFCDSFGPNLRNEIAHGLLDYYRCNSIYVIYAWWFCFKLVFNT